MRAFKKLRIYLASSWRNAAYPDVLAALRAAGHDVYDFRSGGFSWKNVDPNYLNWSNAEFVDRVNNYAANGQFNADLNALDECDTLVLLQPCGRSAHLEAGYCVGKNKQVIVFLDGKSEPELMYRLTSGFVDNIESLLSALSMAGDPKADFNGPWRLSDELSNHKSSEQGMAEEPS
jgi:nucleoside 2-deoxyribosyltransferase